MNRYGLAVLVLLGSAVASFGLQWIDDFDQGMAQAKEAGKYALVDFSGSDWCGWCMKLDKEVFSKKEFEDFAAKGLVCIVVDFPRHKPQSKKDRARNDALMKKYGVEGFPTVLLFSPDGRLAGTTGYEPGGPGPYVKSLQDMIDKDKSKSEPKAKP